MLTYVLAWIVTLGSLGIYLSAFLFPALHRKNDFIWSGIGLFYALILWVYGRRITGGLLLGQTASVVLLTWFGWQILQLRRELLPPEQQTPPAGSLGAKLQELMEQGKRFLARVGIPGLVPETESKPAAPPRPMPQPPVAAPAVEPAAPELEVPLPEPAELTAAEIAAVAAASPPTVPPEAKPESPKQISEKASAPPTASPPAPAKVDLGSRLTNLPIPVDLPKLQERLTDLLANARANLPKLQERVTELVANLRKKTPAPAPTTPSPPAKAAPDTEDLWEDATSEVEAPTEAEAATIPPDTIAATIPPDTTAPETDTAAAAEAVAPTDAEAATIPPDTAAPDTDTAAASEPVAPTDAEAATIPPDTAVPETDTAAPPTLEAEPPHPPSIEQVRAAHVPPEPAPDIDLEEVAPDASLAPPAEAPRSPEVQAMVEQQQLQTASREGEPETPEAEEKPTEAEAQDSGAWEPPASEDWPPPDPID